MIAPIRELRPARLSDAVSVAGLHVRTALHAFADIFPPDAPRPTVEVLTARWSNWIGPECPPKQGVWVVEEGDRLVGVAIAGPDPDDASFGHFSRLYVDPDHWGRGIGRRLHDQAILHLRQQAYRTATLWVLEGNVRTRSWYERLGWRLSGTRKASYPPAGIDDLGYQLTLAPYPPCRARPATTLDGREN